MRCPEEEYGESGTSRNRSHTIRHSVSPAAALCPPPRSACPPPRSAPAPVLRPPPSCARPRPAPAPVLRPPSALRFGLCLCRGARRLRASLQEGPQSRLVQPGHTERHGLVVLGAR